MSTKLRKVVAVKKAVDETAVEAQTVKSVEAPVPKKKVVAKKVDATSTPVVVTETPAVSDVPVTKKLVGKIKAAAKSPVATTTTVATTLVKKAAAKSPAKSPVKSPAKKTPTKKTAAKSPVKKTTAKKAASKKTVAKKTKKTTKAKGGKGKGKGKGKAAVKKPKSKRAPSTKPAPMDVNGLGIGPARVKAVLMNISLNPREFAVRKAIMEAENKPRKPKPTKEDPNPEMPPQGPQVHVDKLPADVLAVIREAEAAHENSLREAYERTVVSAMDEETRTSYSTKRKEAHAKAEETSTEFNLSNFNTSFNKDFYAGYAAYKAENDGYVTGKVFSDKKNNDALYEKYNEWTRAMALVNKLCTRLSGNTRNLIACFVDRIVEQYADNGIHNCLLSERHIVQLRHALTETEGFAERVPLHPFVSTLSHYSASINWIDACSDVREQIKTLKSEGVDVSGEELPAYPDPNYEYNFEGYVGDICRSVKMRKAAKATTEAERVLYLATSVSREFKQFCSSIVYEAILRIGSSLRLAVKRSGVKTISDAMVQYVLEQIHSICGIDFNVTQQAMDERLTRFAEWRVERKDERKRKRESGDGDADADEDDEDDDAEADNAEPDVPEEVDAEETEETEEVEETAADADETEEVEVEETEETADGEAEAEAEEAEEEVDVEYDEETQ